MTYFLLIVGILILLDIVYFAFINQGQTLSVSGQPLIEGFTMDSGLLYFILGMYGLISGVFLSLSKILSLKSEIKAVRRKSEKASVESEHSTDKVKSLEAKIQTLETALKEALKK